MMNCLVKSPVGMLFPQGVAETPATPTKDYGVCNGKLTSVSLSGKKYYNIFFATTKDLCTKLCDSNKNGCIYEKDTYWQVVYSEPIEVNNSANN